jgi:potassium efflux system protein
MRWLLVARRRLAYEAALERRRAAQAEADTADEGTAELPFEELEADLSALSDEARGLIRTPVSITGLIGLYLI